MSVSVSVIVPVYRVSPYLFPCLKSLLTQSLREIEILAVIDGSPDGEEKLLARLAKRDPRLRVFSRPHLGQSEARNCGLKAAKGKYVAFLDGDDWADADLYRRLFLRAEETEADVVAADVIYEWQNVKKHVSANLTDTFSQGFPQKDYCRFYSAVWNKLYRRDFLEACEAKFLSLPLEDLDFSHRLMPFVRRGGAVEGVAVHYRQRKNSLSGKSYSPSHYRTVFEGVRLHLTEKGVFSQWEKEWEYALARHLLCTCLKRAPSPQNARLALSALEEICPRWRQNPYLWSTGAKGLYLKFFRPETAAALIRALP